MRVLHLDKNHPILMSQLENAGIKNEEDYSSSKTHIESIISKYDGIVIRSRFNIDKPFINAATRLKFIARVGAGLESIDVEYATLKNISLFSAPEGNRTAVGEHTLGLLLNLFNNINLADASVKKGQWLREHHRGIELEGKTVGIIGYGNMGKAFAKTLKGFNCKVICYDIKEQVGDNNAQQVPLQTLCNTANILSLHTPWTPQTNQMINAKFINQFKQPFWFINTARGKSVVTKDLVTALQQGKILGAALDVLEFEKLSFESLFSSKPPESLSTLLLMKNVIVTPHIAGWTVESKLKLAQTIADKIIKKFG